MAAVPSGFLLPVVVTGTVLGLTLLRGAQRLCAKKRQHAKDIAGRGANSDFYDMMGSLLNWPSTSLWFNWGLWRVGTAQSFSNAASSLCAAVHECVDPDTEVLIGATR